MFLISRPDEFVHQSLFNVKHTNSMNQNEASMCMFKVGQAKQLISATGSNINTVCMKLSCLHLVNCTFQNHLQLTGSNTAFLSTNKNSLCV